MLKKKPHWHRGAGREDDQRSSSSGNDYYGERTKQQTQGLKNQSRTDPVDIDATPELNVAFVSSWQNPSSPLSENSVADSPRAC